MSSTTTNSEKKKMITPKLRFREFNDDWKFEQLSNLLEFKNGVNADKGQYGRGFKFINVLDILSNDFLTYDSIIGSVDINAETFEKYLVSFGDILFQRSSETREEVGTACVYLDKRPATFGGFVIRGKKIADYDPVFFNKLLKTDLARNAITSKSGGSTRYNVGQETLSSIRLPFPSLPEQQKIASFLSAVDEKIQQLARKKELLQQYKKGVTQQLFSGKLRFKDENGNAYPKWEEKRLGDVGKISAGGDLSKLDYRKDRNKEQGYIYPIYANGAGDGLYGFANKFQYPSNCVTVSGRGNLGYARMRTKKFNAIVRLIVIDPKDNISAKYLEEVINNINFAIESTGVPQLTVPQISAYNISIPSLGEQQKIASALSALDAKIETVATQIAHTQTFKKGLLQQMFV